MLMETWLTHRMSHFNVMGHSLECSVALLQNNNSRRCLQECSGRARQEQLLECHHFKGYVRVCVQRIFLKNTVVKTRVSREEEGLWE